MGPLRKVANRFGCVIEYVAPYTTQQNGKVERQFPTDLHRANSMMDATKLRQQHRQVAIKYASTMANIIYKRWKDKGN
jgi:hypothetical protein